MAAEHGLMGLALWGALLLGNMGVLTWLVWRGGRLRLTWLENHAAMLRASLAAYLVGAACLGIAYWQMVYLLMASVILLRGFAARATSFTPSNPAAREA